MPTLEERLRALAKKGEFVHLSVAFKNDAFHCNFAAASPQGGYAVGVDGNDPVAAIEKALAASPVRRRTPKSRPEREVTATVNENPEPSDLAGQPEPPDFTRWT